MSRTMEACVASPPIAKQPDEPIPGDVLAARRRAIALAAEKARERHPPRVAGVQLSPHRRGDVVPGAVSRGR